MMCLCVLGLVTLMPKTEKASADTTWQTGVFEMDDGASLKLGQVGGLRFIVRMDESVYSFIKDTADAEYGFVIAPKNLLQAAEGDYLNMPLKIGGAADKAKLYKDGDYWFANGCVTDVKAANLERSFAAVAYIKYNGEVRYTEYNDWARNNLYDTVNRAVLSGGYTELLFGEEKAGGYVQNGEGVGWYGSEAYPIVVENTAEYNDLVETVNETTNVDFSDYNVVVKNGATAEKVFANASTAPVVKSESVDEINKLIDALPDAVAMPDAIGMIGRIREVEKKYNALTDTDKESVENYEKVQSLLITIEGYDRVYMNGANDGSVIASYVPNYTSTKGGSATTRTDDVYGNVLTVTSEADGKAAVHIQNFPSVKNYTKLYFYVKTSVGCDIYFSDGITNDGWGADWKNSWSLSGYWCNADNWRLVEIDLAGGYVGTDFALGLRTTSTGFSFEISDFYAINAGKEVQTSVSFGNITDTGTSNEYGPVYDFTQGWGSNTDLGAFNVGALSAALNAGHDSLCFNIYNPNDSDVTFYFNENETWVRTDVTTLKAKVWTEVIISPELIEANKTYLLYCCVTSGAGTAGWQISPIYSFASVENRVVTSLQLGVHTETGTTNGYGEIYNLEQEQYYKDSNIGNGMGTLSKNELADALPSGYEFFYFWMYNPTDTAYNFHLAGDVNGTWTDTPTSTKNLTPKAWTKVTISAEDINLNAQGQWYVYITGGDGAGATKAGWQVSSIYAGPASVSKPQLNYVDHADVKAVINAIDALPDTLALTDKATVQAARAAYNALTSEQQTLVTNLSALTAAEAKMQAMDEASAVIEMIDAIDAKALNETAVENARNAYDALSDAAKAYVTNYATLQAYEAEIAAGAAAQARIDDVISKIAALPESVVMPDHLVFVARIEAAEAAYNALTDAEKGRVTNYARLRTLVSAIKGYDTLFIQTVEGVDVIPSHVPNFTSTVGGTATVDYDGYYGNYLRVTPNAGGKVAIQFKNFPDVSMYTKIYFNIRVVGASCDIYASDGVTNDGWGDGWHNTWSISGYWTNNGNWIQKEIDVSTGIVSPNWALGLRTNTTDVYFEITDIVGVRPDLGEQTNAEFGTMVESGTSNVYGPTYNFTQGWDSDKDLGAFNIGIMRSALNEGHDTLHFYMYNPNEIDVTFSTNENETWVITEVTTLKAKAWTEVILTPAIIAANDTHLIYMCVTSGAGTSGWQISPIYSFSQGDIVDSVQARINALDENAIDEYKVQLAREAFEALNEVQKSLVVTDKLIACETKLYGDVENAPFIVDGATQYKLYISQNDECKTAAKFANEHLAAATGVTLIEVVETPQNISKYRYAIVFGHWDAYAAVGGTKTTGDISGYAGYIIEKIGRMVFVLANSADGYRMGALKFLNETIGYDMMSDDCIIYDSAKAATLPAFNAIGNPFDYRQKQTAMTESEVYGMGMQSNTDIWIYSAKGWDMHNTLHYLPTATYQSAHPSWYYTYIDSINVERTQICPTAGGSSTEFNAMVEAVAANLVERINMFPEKQNISFSIMDTGDNDDCPCARCSLYDTLYGEGGFAAAWIDLMNAINKAVRAQLPAGRTINIAFLAYRATEKAPATIDANGNATLLKRYEINDDGSYTQTSEDLKCDEGVTVWLAPINALYAENLNHADNATHLATVKKWCAISDSVYMWLYGTNFKFYMYPYNTWKSSAENYKILKDLGVDLAWSQSNETEATAFSDLKSYIDSKFMADVNADYETVLTNYFNGYFGSASATMRSLFDKIVAKCEEIENDYDGLGRGIYDEIENTSGFLGIGANTYWSKTWIEECVTLCDEAKAIIDADMTLTDAQKTAIKSRITKESLFPRYVLCTTFASKYSTSNKKAMRQAFKADATALGFTLYCEVDGELSNLYGDWGV